MLTLLSSKYWFFSPYLSDNVLLVTALIMLVSLLVVPVSSTGAAKASIISPSTAKYSRITRRMRKDARDLLVSAAIGSALAFAVSVILELAGLVY